MASEVIAGLGAIKTAYDLAKGIRDIDDGVKRNAAVMDLQDRILAAQQTQADLLQKVNDLSSQLDAISTWKHESERYQLRDFGGRTFAYALREDRRLEDEPPHCICPSCYQNKSKSILQFRGRGDNQDHYYCHACGDDFHLGEFRPDPDSSVGVTWGRY